MWEYKIVYTPIVNGSWNDLADSLTEYGKEGWELVSVDGTNFRNGGGEATPYSVQCMMLYHFKRWTANND